MPTYEQVANAGNVAAQNVYRVRFVGAPASDLPQLQAWDDYQMATVVSESLAGTSGNSNLSLVAAAHTTNAQTPANWTVSPTLAQDGSGGVHLVGGNQVRANRLRGNTAYLLLADTGDLPPAAGDERLFQLAFGAASDSAVGVSGHQPVIAVKTFYAGAAPTLEFYYNRGSEGTPDWVLMTSSVKGTPMAMGVKNTIHATGPGTTSTALDPVTKPGSGEKWAEEQWILTAL